MATVFPPKHYAAILPPFPPKVPESLSNCWEKKNQQNNQPTDHLGTEKRLTEQPKNREQKNL